MTNETDINEPESSVDNSDGADSVNDESNSPDQSGVDVQTPEFQEFSATHTGPTTSEIDRLQDIKIVVSAELGRMEVPIQKLLSIGPGSVLEMDRQIDSPVELVAQGVPLAKGEVVVVNDCFAIRVTEIYQNFKQREAG